MHLECIFTCMWHLSSFMYHIFFISKIQKKYKTQKLRGRLVYEVAIISCCRPWTFHLFESYPHWWVFNIDLRVTIWPWAFTPILASILGFCGVMLHLPLSFIVYSLTLIASVLTLFTNLSKKVLKGIFSAWYGHSISILTKPINLPYINPLLLVPLNKACRFWFMLDDEGYLKALFLVGHLLSMKKHCSRMLN